MYIFVEAYDITRLRLGAIDRLVWCYQIAPKGSENDSTSHDLNVPDFLKCQTIITAYKHTKPNVLRNLVVDGFIESGEKHYDHLSILPEEFGEDLCDRIETHDEVTGAIRDLCSYHGHRNVEEKRKCVVRVNMDRVRELKL